ncbi:MAG TPA: OmpA family protein [Saprospiraceae bacterium]|nr:OmpA family protein [Saprospiraceae bacterium]HQW24567.1 OmpA family protein [Saprospiraceae bacterium]
MRTLLLTLVSFLMLTSLQAQQEDRGYFGIKAGVNLANIRSANHFTDGELLNTKTGLAGGLFYHLPLTKALSIQPELLYSQMGSKFDANALRAEGPEGQVNLNYFSLPILVRVSPFKPLGLFAGPQLDYFVAGKVDYDDDANDEGLSYGASGSSLTFFSVTVGAEIRLFKTVGIYGRYIYGLSDITGGDVADLFTEGSDLYNDALQVGLTIGFPGKTKAEMAEEAAVMVAPLDTDADGTPDVSDKCPLVAGSAKYDGCPVPDTDGDGINDESDKCPALFGTAKYMGCPVPDTDGDGFNDEQDKCPTQAGTLKYNGCPTPDTDGDGINDDDDKCPTQRGTAAYMGCPVPDSDGDGINDDKDKCPHYPGDAANGGCPDMTIYFANAEPTLTADDKARLDKALEVINDNPTTNIVIEGHASTVGEAEYNKKLSQKRADNIMEYFKSKGIAAGRMTAMGYGEEQPIKGANKAEGDLLSRRVVIRVAQ